MKNLWLLLACLCHSAYGWQAMCNTNGTNQPIPRGVAAPYVQQAQILTYSWGGSGESCNAIRSPASACGQYGASASWGGNGWMCFSWPGSFVLQAGGCGLGCPSGYSKVNGQCQADIVAYRTLHSQTIGVTIARNDDGYINSITGPGGYWAVQQRDALGRPTEVMQRNGVVATYAYFPNSPLISTRTDHYGTTSYSWGTSGQVKAVQLPDGSVYNMSYADGHHLSGVGVVNGQTGTSRAGKLAPWGTPIPIVQSALSSRVVPVGVQPYAGPRAGDAKDFIIGYGASYEDAMNNIVFPPGDSITPDPSDDICNPKVIAQDGIYPTMQFCKNLDMSMMIQCMSRHYVSGVGPSMQHAANGCIAGIYPFLVSIGCPARMGTH